MLEQRHASNAIVRELIRRIHLLKHDHSLEIKGHLVGIQTIRFCQCNPCRHFLSSWSRPSTRGERNSGYYVSSRHVVWLERMTRCSKLKMLAQTEKL